MPTKAVCCFTHLATTDFTWRDQDYCVKKFVDAIKGREIKGWAWIQVVPGPKRKLLQANADQAAIWFGEMAAAAVEAEGIVAPVIVPFPNSKCVVGKSRSRTRPLAEALAAAVPDATALDCLRFDVPMAAANDEDGTRDPAEIYPHLRIVTTLPKGRPVVVVDDVLTSGGHVAAGVAKLRSRGMDVRLVVAGATADRQQVADPFARVVRQIDDYVPD